MNRKVSTICVGESVLSERKGNRSEKNALGKLTPQVNERIESIVDNKPAAAERFGQ